MGGSYLTDALLFLANTIFSIYILLVVLRFLLQAVRADSRNPISQFLLQATSPPLRLLRRFIPGFAGVDWSCIILMLMLQAIKLFHYQPAGLWRFLRPSRPVTAQQRRTVAA